MNDVWLERWENGRTGWHEADGSALLRRHWPSLERGSRVLVPLCGKSVDLLWLASQGLEVVGVELSELAIKAFFEENNLEYEVTAEGALPCYRATSMPIRLYAGDYYRFDPQLCEELCDAVFDRGSLIAIEPATRGRYVQRSNSLLKPGAFRMLITLEYDQQAVDGPPFSMTAEDVLGFWPELRRVHSHNDLETGSPKFREAGLVEVIESVWISSRQD